MRLFFAIHPSPTASEEVERMLAREAPRLPSLRFGASTKWHVTLQFLGELDEERALGAERVGADLARAHPPFAIRLASFGVFPSVHHPSVLWVGVSDDGGLHRLAEGLGSALRREGFALESRPYQPHLTLARIKGLREGDEVRAFLERAPSFAGSSFGVGEVSLLESRGGAYLPRRAWSLMGSGPG